MTLRFAMRKSFAARENLIFDRRYQVISLLNKPKNKARNRVSANFRLYFNLPLKQYLEIPVLSLVIRNEAVSLKNTNCHSRWNPLVIDLF